MKNIARSLAFQPCWRQITEEKTKQVVYLYLSIYDPIIVPLYFCSRESQRDQFTLGDKSRFHRCGEYYFGCPEGKRDHNITGRQDRNSKNLPKRCMNREKPERDHLKESEEWNQGVLLFALAIQSTRPGKTQVTQLEWVTQESEYWARWGKQPLVGRSLSSNPIQPTTWGISQISQLIVLLVGVGSASCRRVVL